MRFSQVDAVRIPEGSARKIRHGGKTLWTPIGPRYVSLGDSIAAHSGGGSQYGVDGNTESEISSTSYTNLIHKELIKRARGNASAVSYARSGDKVEDLMEKLTHQRVQNSLKKANYVTVCIGANDILGTVPGHLSEYVQHGDSALAGLITDVNANIARLADDINPNSYRAVFDKLASINPNTKYVFTNVYNPYKYLWVDEGRNGFFGPVLDYIPDISILGFDVDNLVKDGLLSTPIIQTFFDRVNGLGDVVEVLVTNLNNVLKQKIEEYQTINPNFMMADTKALYDVFPDRPVSAPKHYDDLVNVQYTRGWDMGDIHWGRLWDDSDEPDNAADFWWDIITPHVSFSGVDLEAIAAEFLTRAVEEVIAPDIDPHPQAYGQYVLMRSFVDAFGWTALDRHTITFEANGASGSAVTRTIVGVDGLPSFTHLATPSFTPAEGYYLNGWNTASGGGGTAYSNGQYISLAGNMTLYAQWSNIYAVRFRHTKESIYHNNSHTGPMECYAFWIDGQEQADLGAFSNDARIYYLPYGTQLGVVAQTNSGEGRSFITVNGTKVAGNSSDARWGFTLTGNTDIKFEWNYWLSADTNPIQSYWNCYITTY